MKRVVLFFALVALTVCAGCATRAVLKNQFDVQEAQAALRPGNNCIKGSAVILKMNGQAVTCAGRQVWLVPVTRYSTEVMQGMYGNAQRGYMPANAFDQRNVSFSNLHPQFNTLGLRTVLGNTQGFFVFDRVKDGDYFVVTKITWFVPGHYSPEGGHLMQRVAVLGGETVEIVLAP